MAGAMFFSVQSALGQVVHSIPTGSDAAAEAARAEKEEKEYKLKDRPDRFTYGKKHETAVTTESSNATIQKTKHGTSDATVPTGVFKESFLDVGLSSAAAPRPSPTPKAKSDNPLRSTSAPASPSPSAQSAASASPAPSAAARLDITTGVSPAPELTASPKPH